MTPSADRLYRFQDGAAYERYMGRWSRAACGLFLPWLAAPLDAAWLDVGCGTGVLTEAILATQRPTRIDAFDPAAAQVELAQRKITSPLVRFGVADASAMPYRDGACDVVASALVVNFIPDRQKAVAEMHRVLRVGGSAAAFVWDFAADRSPSGPVRQALAALGVEVPPTPGGEDSRLPALEALFAAAGFRGLATRSFDVQQHFADAEAFWEAQATGFSPVASIVKRQSPEVREAARLRVHGMLAPAPGGGVTYTARAHAVKGRKA